MIIKYKSLYKIRRTVYLVHYLNEEDYRVIITKDSGKIIKNEIVGNEDWLASSAFENIIHSERKKHEA